MTSCLPLSIFRFPSTFLIPLKSQLDDAARGPLYNCLDIKLEGCKRYKPESVEFHECITKSFFNCLSKNRKHLRSKEEIETYKIGKECLNTCLKKCKDSRLHLANCLVKCF